MKYRKMKCRSQEKWLTLQNKYRLEDAQTEPMVSIIANDNWVEFTLRYIVNYKKRRMTKTALFTQILKSVDVSNGKIKFASATFQLVDTPEIKVKLSTDEDKIGRASCRERV